MNILSNGIDALEESVKDGKIQQLAPASVPTIHISTKLLNQDWAIIRIADNGYGIDQQVQKKLFDPFFTTKDVGKGTGLGLSISYQIIVELHGGQLECNSSPGTGTEFVIQIPIRQVQNHTNSNYIGV